MQYKRYWKTIIIYIYGDPGTGKSEICKDLFPGIYEKADNEWWEKYNDEEFNYDRDISILLDDFYRSCSWTNLLRLTDRNYCKMNVKYGKTYIVAIVKFIIKYEGESIDENGKGDIIRIFEKGNKKEFNERIFDIECNKGTTLEEVEKVTIDLGIEGEIYQDRQSWDNIINKYSIIEDIDNKTDRVVTNIPKSDPDPQEDSSKTEKSCLQLEIQQNYQKSLKAKENIVENNDDDFDMYKDIELDISEETIHEEFNRKNKNNSLYLGFKKNSNICKYCFKKHLTEQDCIKIKPSCYKEEIKNLNKLLNKTKLKNLELEKQILTLKRNHQLFKKNIENLNTILNFQ
ncbi:hypothetical protein C2G38_2196551 [Gigaspora rosea]|uniref:Helicase superfamily 3 single-stranded DNA/RNA virus domain-containing protein n=1 Tax=Gigaspora rosea TaxID=44941 RepID=A0A397UX24_9GLOM|nr:hypothetical protein C2G38_2196551 [Gigaspora rosea]